jgi:hypothetical protein
MIRAGPFQGLQISRLLDDANDRAVAPCVGADLAAIAFAQIETDGTVPNVALHVFDGASQAKCVFRRLLEDIMRQPIGRFRPDSWEPGELFSQTPNAGTGTHVALRANFIPIIAIRDGDGKTGFDPLLRESR